MVMSRDHSAGRIRNLKIDNISFERGGEIKYLETNLTYQGMFPINRYRIFCLPVCYLKIKKLRYTEL